MLAALALVGALTLQSLQLAASVALVGLVLTAYVGHPPAGLAVLWSLWLFAPLVRRVFGQYDGYVDADPLAVAPFAATLLVAAATVVRHGLPVRLRWLVGLTALGLTFGLPRGVSDPNATVFALFAYSSALTAVILGHHEGTKPLERLSLARALVFGAPVLAVYALYQYYVELPVWDATWLDTVEFTSVGAPEEGKFRSFSTVNAPALLAILMALAILFGIARKRLTVGATAVLGLFVAILALTYVRSAWIALVVGALIFGLLAGVRALPRIGVLAAVLVAGIAALSLAGGTSAAFTERLTTLGALEEDTSANERVATPTTLLPVLVREPFGFGLGAAGEASRLRTTGAILRATDNGLLSMILQLGLVGGLLVVGSLLWGMGAGLRGLRRGPLLRARTAALGGVFAFFFVLMLTGDQFYGMPGVLLWYLVGVGLRTDSDGYESDLA
jgi:hypothetical protein